MSNGNTYEYVWKIFREREDTRKQLAAFDRELDLDPKFNEELKTPNRKAILVRLSGIVHKDLKHAAIENKTSVNDIINEAIFLWLLKYKQGDG